jgi:hypothetical protein
MGANSGNLVHFRFMFSEATTNPRGASEFGIRVMGDVCAGGFSRLAH